MTEHKEQPQMVDVDAMGVDAARSEAEHAELVVVVDGFTLRIDPESLDDYEVWDLASQGQPFRLFELFAGDQKQAILAYLKGTSKRLPTGRVVEFIQRAAEAVGRGN